MQISKICYECSQKELYSLNAYIIVNAYNKVEYYKLRKYIKKKNTCKVLNAKFLPSTKLPSNRI